LEIVLTQVLHVEFRYR